MVVGSLPNFHVEKCFSINKIRLIILVFKFAWVSYPLKLARNVSANRNTMLFVGVSVCSR